MPGIISFTDIRSVNILLRSIISLFLLCVVGIAAHGQEDGYFSRIEKVLPALGARQQCDTILAVPYNEMVADFDLSIAMLHNAYGQASKSSYPLGQGRASEKMSIVHYLKGEYDSAAFYNLRAQEIFERNNHTEELGAALSSYGYMVKRRNLPEAFRLMRKGIGILKNEKSNGNLPSAIDNFGVLHEMNGDLDSAVFYYSQALAMKEELRDSVGIPYSLNNLGGAFLIEKKYEAALPYFEKAYAIRQQQNDAFGVLESQSLFGDLYKNWDKSAEAIQWYELSNAGCDSIQYPFLKQYNLEQLATCYEASGNPDLALTALRGSMLIKDSLLNEKNLKQINELEQKFKSAEKDKSIAQLEEKNLKRRQFILVVSSALLLVLFGSLLYSQVQKRKARAAKDKAIIEERDRGIEAVFTATEEERRRIAKDLHDGVGQQLSGLRLSFEGLSIDIKNALPNDAERIIKLNEVLDEACNEVRNISHRMMPKSLSETGLLPAIDDMLRKSIGLSGIAYRLEHFKVEDERFHERIELGLFRVCQELVNNILKHSGATEVVVQLFKSKTNLVLIVEDNGKGFSPQSQKDGIGLTNITSRINTVDGEVTWQPGPQQGTVATVRVPIA